MKFRASSFLKQMCSVVVAVVKAKSTAVKSKTSELKTRLLILGLLKNKKVLMKAINHKIHALMSQEKGEGGAHSAEDHDKAVVLHDAAKNAALTDPTNTEPMYCYDDDDDDDHNNYPDLRHSLFDSEEEEEDDDELGNTTGSVIDLVKNSKEDGSEFRLEDEIDHAADVFIKRFHRQMRMQKLESFKRYREMLLRGV